MDARSTSKRRFLRAAALAAGGGILAGPAGLDLQVLSDGTPKPRAFPGRGEVALARGKGVGSATGAPVDEALLRRWLGEMLKALTGAERPSLAWKAVFGPDDIVGVKLNCLAGPRLSPRPELIAALAAGLQDAGVKAENILIWDRTERELKRAGFRLNPRGTGHRVYATDSLPRGYESMPRLSGSIGSCFSRLLTERCSVLINVGVLKDHDLAGVSIGLKNFYGAIHNPNKYHDNNCDPYVADLANHPAIRDRLRLTICDGLTAQCNGGPAFLERWSWNYGGLLASRDPVALDRVGADIVERRRAELGLPALADAGRDPSYIQTAGRLGLGEDDPAGIRVHEVS